MPCHALLPQQSFRFGYYQGLKLCSLYSFPRHRHLPEAADLPLQVSKRHSDSGSPEIDSDYVITGPVEFEQRRFPSLRVISPPGFPD
ncbi:hypothetical protein D3C72_2222340 [compost metagenome]